MTVSRNARAVLAFVLLVAALPASALEADIRARIAHVGEAWIGQQLMLQIELLTDGQSFRGQRFRIPDIAGALLLEDAVNTTKLSEERDGVAWQVLRYEFPLFAQRAGSLSIPSIAVAFSVTSGFGGDTREVELTTTPLPLAVKSPAGVLDARQLVTTTAFTLDVKVLPPPEDLQVGDAVTRTITRRAVDVPGMVFAPLPLPGIDGVAAYPKSAEVDARHNRGELTGERTESVSFVFQRAGTFRLPGYELQWWDPVRASLHSESVPELMIEVAANPAFSTAASGNESVDRVRELRHLVPMVIALIIAGALACRYRSTVHAQWQRRREARAASERFRFRAFIKACTAGDPARTYRAYYRWQPLAEIRRELAANEPALESALLELQQALVAKGSRWTGVTLAAAARQARRRMEPKRRTPSHHALPSLNPLPDKVMRTKC
ncbi:MAG: BatD family protein [Gammaproteobacteria bacterium]|jgi:hypothetical protein